MSTTNLGSTYEGNNVIKTTYQHTYRNFAYHNDYLCTKCAYGAGYIIYTIFITLSYALMFAGLVYILIHNSTERTLGIIMEAIFLIVIVLFWVSFFRIRKSIKKDKYLDDKWYQPSKGREKVIELMRKKMPPKTFFTPEDMQKLR